MTEQNNKPRERIFVAIDVAKAKNDVLIEYPDGKRKRMTVVNRMEDFIAFAEHLGTFKKEQCCIGVEPTSNYHRPISYFLKEKGFLLNFVPSIGVARTREAMHNSWDKNDPKDAQVILHMLKIGLVQTYYDPLLNGINDIQELSKTHFLISLRKTKTQHSILNHYLPLYFPEAQKYFSSSRAEWFFRMLHMFPSPHYIKAMGKEEFIKKAWKVSGRKVAKEVFLSDFFEAAKNSIGIPVLEDSESLVMFRLVLQEALALCEKRQQLEDRAHEFLKQDPQYKILRSIPGIGPIIALTIIAESGDMKRFSHHRKYLKFCGLDLSTHQSGQFRGQSRLSKRGNSRLRCAFWMAATIAVRMRSNTLRGKYERYIKRDPTSSDLKRKALTASAAKICRVAYSLVKAGKPYRPYFDEAIPSGGIRSVGP